MKVIHSSIFRAVCAIIVGVLLIQYREQTVTWITIAIGVLFFLSGVISLASYWAAKRNAEKMQGQILSDSNGKPIMGMIPKFPLVSVGSLILGLLLAHDRLTIGIRQNLALHRHRCFVFPFRCHLPCQLLGSQAQCREDAGPDSV